MADSRTAKTPLFVTDGISWVGLFAGPLAWVLDEEISYSLTDWSCKGGPHWPTHVVSGLAIALILTGIALSGRDWRRRAVAGTSANAPPDRARFLAIGGFTLCLLFGMAVMIDTVAKFYFDPCQR